MHIGDIAGFKDFLDSETTAVLTVPIDDEGTLHSAALLYAYQESPLKLIFVTSSETEKCTLLKSGPQKASCVIGTIKGVPFSMQMRGTVELVPYDLADKEMDVLDIYEAKWNKRVDDTTDLNQIVLLFFANWARCTDYNDPNWEKGLSRHDIATQ